MSESASASPEPRSGDFLVHLAADLAIPFQQVEVRSSDLPVIEVRHGNSPVFYPIKMPGLGRVGNVLLSAGTLTDVADRSALQRRMEAGEGSRGTIAIDLRDENGATQATWNLNNAWPTQAAADTPTGCAVATLEIRFESLAIVAPKEA